MSHRRIEQGERHEAGGSGDPGAGTFTMDYYFNYVYGASGRLSERIWGDPLGDHAKFMHAFTNAGSSYTMQILNAEPIADFEVYGIGRLNRYE